MEVFFIRSEVKTYCDSQAREKEAGKKDRFRQNS